MEPRRKGEEEGKGCQRIRRDGQSDTQLWLRLPDVSPVETTKKEDTGTDRHERKRKREKA